MNCGKTRIKVHKYCWLTFSCIAMALIFPHESSCQDNYNERKKEWRLSAGMILNFFSVTDKNFSALTYRGSSPGVTVALHYKGNNTEHEVAAVYVSNGKLSSNTSPQAILNTTIFNIDYTNLYPLVASSDNSFNCKAGAVIQFLNNGRKFDQLINSNFSFETALSVGPVAELQYAIGKNNHSLVLTNRITLPLLYIFSQPSFSGNSPQDMESENGTALKKLFTNNKTVSLSEFIRLKNQFEVAKTIGAHHSIALVYNWEYYKIKSARAVIALNNQAGIQYRYKF